jgi:ketosteroid isomerase-like protein
MNTSRTEKRMSESNLATVRRLYGFIAEDNFEEANKMMLEDVVFSESTDLPYGGEYHGIAGLNDLMGRIAARAKLSVARVDYLSETESADPVVVHVVARYVSNATGEEVLADVVELVSVRDGRIAAIDIYCKNPSVIAALWR